MLTVPFDFLQRSIFYTGVLSFFVLNLMEKKTISWTKSGIKAAF